MNTKNLLTLLVLGAFVTAALGADFDKAVSDLIPKLADENVPARYGAQMQLQDLASQSSKPGNEADRAALGKVLAARAGDASVPQPARVWMVRQIEYMGGVETVPALSALLNGPDAELRECARRALEKNSAPEASKPLWDALQKVATETGADSVRWKIGLINSLAERRDTAAVGLIVPRLGEEGVGVAAAMALGRIANPPAMEALWSVFPRNPAAGDALIVAAKRLGQASEAAAAARRLYDQAGQPSLKAAALSVLAKADPDAGAKLIADALVGAEPRLQQAALAAASSLYGKELTARLAPLFPKLGAAAKVHVLALVDSSAEPQVIAAASDADEPIRRGAFEALGRMGGAASVPVLLAAATDDSKPGRSAADSALKTIPSAEAAAAIEKAAGAGDAKVRVTALNALAARKQVSALPVIFNATTEADSGVRRAAFSALKSMAADAEIEPLAKLVLAGKNEAGSALASAAQRAQDKPAAARKLLALSDGNEEKLALLLEGFSILGGDESLGVVVKLTANANADVQNDAVRALGNWTDFAATRPLMALASNPETKLNQYVLAMQGLAQLVRSVDTEPADKRVDLALQVMKTARRVEEKKLALSTLAAVPHRKAAEAIKPLLTDPQLKAEACAAAVTLADALSRSDRRSARDLATAVKAATDNADVIRRADRVLSR